MSGTTKLPIFSEDNPQVVSTKNLAIPLWLVLPIVTGAVAFTFYVVNLLNEIKTGVKAANSNRWGKNEQREFARELERANYGKITIPDVDAISTRLQN